MRTLAVVALLLVGGTAHANDGPFLLTIGEATVKSGSADAAAVTKVIANSESALHACYEKVPANKRSQLQGSAVSTFTIGTDGKVKSVKVSASLTKLVSTCITAAIKKCASKPLDVHLMITDPGQDADAVLDAGAELLTCHLDVGRNGEGRRLRVLSGCGGGRGGRCVERGRRHSPARPSR